MAASWKLEFPYRRSVGPVIGAFLTALRDRHVVGVRTPDGRVLVPPFEYDPGTGESLTEMVDVASAGVVEHAAWVPKPLRVHPLDKPFAWALVRLDGADTPLLHAFDCGSAANAVAGARVQIRWRGETTGHLSDIECFEPA